MKVIMFNALNSLEMYFENSLDCSILELVKQKSKIRILFYLGINTLDFT